MNKAVLLYYLLEILEQWYYLQSICHHGDGYFLVPVDSKGRLSLVTPPPHPSLEVPSSTARVVEWRGLGSGQSPVVSPCPCPFSPPVNAARSVQFFNSSLFVTPITPPLPNKYFLQVTRTCSTFCCLLTNITSTTRMFPYGTRRTVHVTVAYS